MWHTRWHLWVINYLSTPILAHLRDGVLGGPFDILNGYLQSSHFVTFLVLIHCNRQS